MDEVLYQEEIHVCWAISLTRQATFLLRLNRVIGDKERLSIQYLISAVGSTKSKTARKAWGGLIPNFEVATRFLIEGGPVLNHDCSLTSGLRAKNSAFNGKKRYNAFEIIVHMIDDSPTESYFEKDLLQCLKPSPVVAAVLMEAKEERMVTLGLRRTCILQPNSWR
ncbi:hypothetical protein Bca4012_036384 [Brassica carinata]